MCPFNILALDFGQDCGHAAQVDGKIISGVWSLKPSKFDSAGVKFLKFKRHIEAEIEFYEIKKVFYEAVRRHLGTDSAHCFGSYMGVCVTLCLEKGIEYEGVPVQTIKKHATGSGNADKKQMVMAAITKYPKINILNDDHADALHLLDYALTISKQ